MGILGSIKKGFSVAASSFPVALFLFVFGFVFNLITLRLAPQIEGPNPQASPMMIVAGVIFIFLTIFMQSASMAYVRDKIKQSTVSFGQFFSLGFKYYFKILLLSLLIAAIIGVFVLAAALIAAFLGQTMEWLAMGIAIVIAAVGIYAVILLFFAPYAAIADEKGVWASISTSVATVRKNILKVAGITLILVAIGFIIGMLMGLGISLTANAIPAAQSQILFAFLSSFVNAFLGLFVTASFMSFYLGLSAPASPAPAEAV